MRSVGISALDFLTLWMIFLISSLWTGFQVVAMQRQLVRRCHQEMFRGCPMETR